jgi:RNA polymerase sigma-70 factor (ECF subfamily)
VDQQAVLSLKGLGTDRRAREVASLLEAQLPAACRLASWILRDASAAEDAVSEAMLRAWQRRATLRDLDAADAWFTRILTNVCRDLLRRRRRSATVAWSAPREVVDPGATASDRDEIGRGLEQLTPDERILLALRHGQDLSVPAIAARLGLAEGTVKSRLHAAHGHLRAAIEAGRREPERVARAEESS